MNRLFIELCQHGRLRLTCEQTNCLRHQIQPPDGDAFSQKNGIEIGNVWKIDVVNVETKPTTLRSIDCT